MGMSVVICVAVRRDLIVSDHVLYVGLTLDLENRTCVSRMGIVCLCWMRRGSRWCEMEVSCGCDWMGLGVDRRMGYGWRKRVGGLGGRGGRVLVVGGVQGRGRGVGVGGLCG